MFRHNAVPNPITGSCQQTKLRAELVNAAQKWWGQGQKKLGCVHGLGSGGEGWLTSRRALFVNVTSSHWDLKIVVQGFVCRGF